MIEAWQKLICLQVVNYMNKLNEKPPVTFEAVSLFLDGMEEAKKVDFMEDKMEGESVTRTHIECDCTCSILEISDWKGDGESIISLYASAFYGKQHSIPRAIGRRIKAAWFMLRGKEFRLYELCVPTEQLKNIFKEYLENKV